NIRPERYVVARQSRQARLTEGSPYPLQLHAVLDEAVIRRRVGGPQVMVEQLQHLLTVCKECSVTIQVVPFGARSYGAMSSGCTIVGYGEEDEDPPVVYLEYAAGGALVENKDDVRRFKDLFTEVVEYALPPAKSAMLIKSQVRALERHDE